MRNILLAVCGLAPQVITEAIYALFHGGKQVHSVQVITTRQGKDRLLTGLFDPDCPRLERLLADFGLTRSDMDFSSGNIHSLRNQAGVEIDDIVTAGDNEILLQTCLDLAFRFTREENNAVWFLVAGGRKTMTSCLTLAAQLYGRKQDRLLHVLVTPEFENCRDFWYPPREPAMVQLTDGRGQPYLKETRYADIQLITIPFVSVRDMLDRNMLDQPRRPADLMQSLIREPVKTLIVNLAEGKISYGGMELDMHPARLALYAFFAEQKKQCQDKKNCAGCHDCFLDASTIISGSGISAMYGRIPGSHLLSEMSETGIGSLSKENFNSYKSKIRKDILRAFGQAHLAELEIGSVGTRLETRYGIRLDRRRIKFAW